MGGLLQGKVAVVTGSGQGIGRAIAIALAKEGAKVVTNNRRPGSTKFVLLSEEQLNALSEEQRQWVLRLSEEYSGDAETTAQRIRELGGEAVAFFGDISSFEVAGQLIQTALDRFGRIDILVNVAGTFGFCPVWEMTPEMWDRVNLVKPRGYFNCIRHALPHMMAQRWGRIINCTSRAWLGDNLRHCQYAAANAGVVGLTRAVAMEVFRYGITCNAFDPWAKTRASVELEAHYLAGGPERGPYSGGPQVPFEITPNPEEICPFIVYLASEEAAGVTGTVFNLAGSSIGIYSEPEVVRSIVKFGGTWTIEELREQVPRVLLRGYRARAADL
jgi:3-oxoacyl-[acyl-carrier protein] reductase